MTGGICLIDVSYLVHRSHYTVGALEHGGQRTGVLFGFLREIAALQTRYGFAAFGFAADSTFSYRKLLFRDYKGNRRKDETPEAAAERRLMYDQQDLLIEEILPAIAPGSVFRVRGYEADDLIARAVTREDRPCSIFSNDGDLFQLLRPGVQLIRGKSATVYTHADFVREWKINPADWPFVKAAAGCSTDNIPGLAGVGEKTAAKYLRGETADATTEKIRNYRNGPDFYRNWQLVLLPFKPKQPGDAEPLRVPDPPKPGWPFDRAAWLTVLKKYGLETLADPAALQIGRANARKIKKGRNVRAGNLPKIGTLVDPE